MRPFPESKSAPSDEHPGDSRPRKYYFLCLTKRSPQVWRRSCEKGDGLQGTELSVLVPLGLGRAEKARQPPAPPVVMPCTSRPTPAHPRTLRSWTR